jgi:hypothetical protein
LSTSAREIEIVSVVPTVPKTYLGLLLSEKHTSLDSKHVTIEFAFVTESVGDGGKTSGAFISGQASSSEQLGAFRKD